MNDNHQDQISDELKELTRQVAHDTRMVHIQIPLCDLMAIVYAIQFNMMAEAGNPHFPMENYGLILSSLVDTIYDYHPDFIDGLYDAVSHEDALKNWQRGDIDGINN